MRKLNTFTLAFLISSLCLNIASVSAVPNDERHNSNTDVRTIITEDDNTRTIVVGVNKPKTELNKQSQVLIVPPNYNCYAPNADPRYCQNQQNFENSPPPPEQ